MRALYKIVHTNAATVWQDREKRILDEALWMRDQGHQVVIISPAISPLLARAKANKLTTYPLAFKGLALGHQFAQLKNILSNEQPNIINAHGLQDGKIALKAAKKAEVPCRILSRHIGGRLRNSWQNRHLFKRLSHYIFTGSRHIAEQTKQNLNLKDMRVFCIPDGIALPEGCLPSREDARQRLAEALHLKDSPRFVGLTPLEFWGKRDCQEALNAFDRVHSKTGHHLIIPSQEMEGLLSPTIERLSLREFVHFVPPPEDKIFYRALDVCVHIPQRAFNRIPRPILEAIFADCPVVAGRSEGIQEIITHRETGLLYEPGAPENLTTALLENIIEKEATRARTETARKLAEKRHAIDVMGRDIIRIYRLHQVKLERRYYKVTPEAY